MSIAERDVTGHPDRGDDPISEFEEEFEPGDGDTRRRLVVVGNGMAGARTVEERAPTGSSRTLSIASTAKTTRNPAPIIGIIAGFLVVFAVLAIDKVLDDPVGALSAHGLAGIWGPWRWASSPPEVDRGRSRARHLVRHLRRVPQHGLRPAGGAGPGGRVHVRGRFLNLDSDVRGDKGDDRPPRLRRGGGSRAGHQSARDVWVPGAVHPAAGVLTGAEHVGARPPAPAPATAQ